MPRAPSIHCSSIDEALSLSSRARCNILFPSREPRERLVLRGAKLIFLSGIVLIRLQDKSKVANTQRCNEDKLSNNNNVVDNLVIIIFCGKFLKSNRYGGVVNLKKFYIAVKANDYKGCIKFSSWIPKQVTTNVTSLGDIGTKCMCTCLKLISMIPFNALLDTIDHLFLVGSFAAKTSAAGLNLTCTQVKNVVRIWWTTERQYKLKSKFKILKKENDELPDFFLPAMEVRFAIPNKFMNLMGHVKPTAGPALPRDFKNR
ncbi:hypothetical protein RND71_042259 [Anisodus tanguticus]|uniref:Uncharacterized protein n=1 Tax=Anisodus tanguticus TaxID=243964 RepID=A0AAE1QTD2_9SOLA|nr:hypothetical protein RND71_042259 [Anisodus tanguticus]